MYDEVVTTFHGWTAELSRDESIFEFGKALLTPFILQSLPSELIPSEQTQFVAESDHLHKKGSLMKFCSTASQTKVGSLGCQLQLVCADLIPKISYSSLDQLAMILEGVDKNEGSTDVPFPSHIFCWGWTVHRIEFGQYLLQLSTFGYSLSLHPHVLPFPSSKWSISAK